MAKPSRGATRPAAGKKKLKKRSELQATRSVPAEAAALEPVRGEMAPPAERPGGTTLQFRPREAVAARGAGAKGASVAKVALQAVDYSYVYTDLRIIGGLAVVLFGGLVALSFVIH